MPKVTRSRDSCLNSLAVMAPILRSELIRLSAPAVEATNTSSRLGWVWVRTEMTVCQLFAQVVGRVLCARL